MRMSECLRLSDNNFQKEVLESELPVFVDFWGSWCPPCKMIEPIIDQLAHNLKGQVKVCKLNVDQNPATRSKFNVAAAPTFIIFNSGKVIGRTVGAKSKKQLLEMIEAVIAQTKVKQAIAAISSVRISAQKNDSVIGRI